MHLQQAVNNVFVQLSETIRLLTPSQYIQQCGNLGNNTIGQHVRHVIELFQCLDAGYPESNVSCYLGRANNIYEAPRKVLEALDAELHEMKRCRSNGFCCGAGGAQMFKEEEKGNKRVNTERTEEAVATGATIIAAACPFCNTMLTDGIKSVEKEDTVQVMDIAELVARSMQ